MNENQTCKISSLSLSVLSERRQQMQMAGFLGEKPNNQFMIPPNYSTLCFQETFLTSPWTAQMCNKSWRVTFQQLNTRFTDGKIVGAFDSSSFSVSTLSKPFSWTSLCWKWRDVLCDDEMGTSLRYNSQDNQMIERHDVCLFWGDCNCFVDRWTM